MKKLTLSLILTFFTLIGAVAQETAEIYIICELWIIFMPERSSLIKAFRLLDFCRLAFQCFSDIMEITKTPTIKNGRVQSAASASFQFLMNIITITETTVTIFGMRVVTAFSIISLREFVSPIIRARIFPEGRLSKKARSSF